MASPSANAVSLSEGEELHPSGGPGCSGQHPGRLGSTECAQPGVVEKARPRWGNPLQFLLACVSYAVGLGNVWRFPYLCQMYGGGIASLVVSFFVSVYYNVINSWAIWYLFHSFQEPLPWSVCPLNGNRTGYDEECEKASSTQYFWYRKTLNISPSIQENGGVQWEPALCLTLAWLIVYLCILRGTESTGKVVYFTASMPYFVLIIYLVRGLTLHGATNGLAYMFTPKMEQLANPKAWINAATQIFFSLGLGCGGLIAFASYNEPSNNCQKHAIIVSIINSTTAIFASIVTFSIYGFKATFNYENCLSKLSFYHTQAVQGTGLAFIVYTEAIKNMEVSQLWSVLYFFMLLMLGMGSMVGTGTAILTPLTDSKLISSYLPKEAISGQNSMQRRQGMGGMGKARQPVEGLPQESCASKPTPEGLQESSCASATVCCSTLGDGLRIRHSPGKTFRRTTTSHREVGPSLGEEGVFHTISSTSGTAGHMVTKDYSTQALAVIGLLVASSTMCIPLVALGTFVTRHFKSREKFPVA
nr:sodium- and chloride-dependent transporter XTRP3B-like [Meriones unguiculatus]